MIITYLGFVIIIIVIVNKGEKIYKYMKNQNPNIPNRSFIKNIVKFYLI